MSVFGVRLKANYCCSKLKSITVTFSQAAIHLFSKDNKHNGCCKSQIKFINVKDSYIASTVSLGLEKPPAGLHNTVVTLWKSLPSNIPKKIFANSGFEPRMHHGVPVYVYNCIYRI